jgi:hypothetical protein
MEFHDSGSWRTFRDVPPLAGPCKGTKMLMNEAIVFHQRGMRKDG